MIDADIIAKLAQSNPGAIAVLADAVTDGAAFFLSFVMDERWLRGLAIWVAYNDVCYQNLDELERMCAEEPERLRELVEARL